MIPTKVRDLIPKVAEHIGIPEDDLDKIVSFYFRENKRLLSELTNTRITLRGLGVMKIKGWELEKRIFDNKMIIKASTNLNNIQLLKKQIELYKKANEKWIDHETEKIRMRGVKNQYYANKNNSDDFERKDTDSMEE